MKTELQVTEIVVFLLSQVHARFLGPLLAAS